MYKRQLSGNGQMAYDKDSNRLTGRDFKDGDYMYIQYAFLSLIHI